MTQMAPSLDDLYALSVMLEPGERITLARWLLESVDPEPLAPEPGHEEAWRAELVARAAELDEHPESALPWSAVQERLKRTVDGG